MGNHSAATPEATGKKTGRFLDDTLQSSSVNSHYSGCTGGYLQNGNPLVLNESVLNSTVTRNNQ